MAGKLTRRQRRFLNDACHALGLDPFDYDGPPLRNEEIAPLKSCGFVKWSEDLEAWVATQAGRSALTRSTIKNETHHV